MDRSRPVEDPRRSIDELIVSYELETAEREIITEGRKDAGIVSWFLNQLGLSVPVYAVDDRVQIDRDQVEAAGHEWGNRGMVATVAIQADKVEAASRGITCIIDADFDRVFNGQLPVASCLLLTDYTAIEMYSCVPRVVEKFFKVALRSTLDIDGADVIRKLSDFTRKAFVARWILKQLASGIPLVKKLDSRATDSGGMLTVDLPAIIRDSIAAHGVKITPPVMVQAIDRAEQAERDLLEFDMRQTTHGHDFVYAFALLLKRYYRSLLRDDRAIFKNIESVDIALRLAVEVVDLINEPLFTQLMARLR